MLSPIERASAHAENLEAALEADAGLMRLYSGIWYGSLALFALWLACVAYSSF